MWMDYRLSKIEKKIDAVIASQGAIQEKENTIMADLTTLTNQVQQTTTVEESAVVLINGLAAQLAEAGTDPVKLQNLQMQLAQSSNALAAAVTANTQSAPSSPTTSTPTTVSQENPAPSTQPTGATSAPTATTDSGTGTR